jgi:transglutaminase-like putative cysteine protease
VLGFYDGRTWTRLLIRQNTSRPAVVESRGAPIRYQITQEPSGRNSLFALELPETAPQVAENSSRITPDLQILTRQPIIQRIRYDVASRVDFSLQPTESPEVLRSWLQLPPRFNPQTHAFAASLRRQSSDDREMVNAVLKFFREKNFRYTLQPPLLGPQAIDDFLFSTRAGFCEHYASAFVVLMRMLDIPARVVTGYQGGEVNAVDGFMSIRQSDAHAWAEVWLKDRGWTRVDPTSAVAPNRVEMNLTSAIPPSLLGGLVDLEVGQDSWFARMQTLRQNWDAVNNGWNQWVLDYTPDRQRSIIQSLGFSSADRGTLTALMFGLSGIVMALVAVPLIRNRTKTDPVDALYLALCREMAARGCAKAIYEGPRAYCQRLTAPQSPLPPDKKDAAARFLTLYETVRYGQPGMSDGMNKKSSAALVSQLKSLLTECR